ncbi:hypothetical protein SAMN05216338_1025111 [Bradyrhizobium sp. Rc2d]|nr:hypothetical protein SAMN05216338_1025111 [Bradyrhizobium sp. Rc2d]
MYRASCTERPKKAAKRAVLNILKSYTGYYDAFSEMIQNALNAFDESKRLNPQFLPRLWVKIDLQKNSDAIAALCCCNLGGGSSFNRRSLKSRGASVSA